MLFGYRWPGLGIQQLYFPHADFCSDLGIDKHQRTKVVPHYCVHILWSEMLYNFIVKQFVLVFCWYLFLCLFEFSLVFTWTWPVTFAMHNHILYISLKEALTPTIKSSAIRNITQRENTVWQDLHQEMSNHTQPHQQPVSHFSLFQLNKKNRICKY